MKNAILICDKKYHWASGLVHFYSDNLACKNNEIPRIIYELIDLLQIESNLEREEIRLKIDNNLGSEIKIVDVETGRKLKALISAIDMGLKYFYNKGKEDGKKALIMLNNGEITLEQFDKQ